MRSSSTWVDLVRLRFLNKRLFLILSVIVRYQLAPLVRSELRRIIVEHNVLKLDSQWQDYYESNSGSSFILFDP